MSRCTPEFLTLMTLCHVLLVFSSGYCGRLKPFVRCYCHLVAEILTHSCPAVFSFINNGTANFYYSGGIRKYGAAYKEQ